MLRLLKSELFPYFPKLPLLFRMLPELPPANTLLSFCACPVHFPSFTMTCHSLLFPSIFYLRYTSQGGLFFFVLSLDDPYSQAGSIRSFSELPVSSALFSLQIVNFTSHALGVGADSPHVYDPRSWIFLPTPRFSKLNLFLCLLRQPVFPPAGRVGFDPLSSFAYCFDPQLYKI